MLVTLPIRDVLPGGARARVVRLDLGGRPFPYRPGQAVLIADHGHDTRKAYSLATAPRDALATGALELLVGVDGGGRPGSHLTLERGGLVDVEGPLGHFVFPDNPEERHVLFIAGGTGIAPLRAMLRHTVRVEGRRIGLFYSVRTLRDFAYEEELRALAREGIIELNLTVTRDQGEWEGSRGRLGASDLASMVHDPATLCFVCGPPALVKDVPAMLAGCGIEEDRIRIEKW